MKNKGYNIKSYYIITNIILLLILRISNKYHTEYARKILKKAELALVRERIAWTRRQLCGVDERIAILTEELWMTLNEEHYSTAKRMISASPTRTFNKARSTQIAKVVI